MFCDASVNIWRLRKRGIKNALLCRFMTWFWFNRENRRTRWPTKVAEVLGPSTFRVDRGGSRRTVWLRGEGCIGYEYPRQMWIAIGEWLRRYRWFVKWNRARCPKCDNDTFKSRYRDTIAGHLCEEIMICDKCSEDVYEFAYGDSRDWYTDRWMQYEEKIFGAVEKT
jgi:hypothetical protein